MSKVRFFVQDVESGEPMYYAGDGDDVLAAVRALGHFAEYAFEELAHNPDGEDHTFVVTAKRMTDEEVAALPDV